MVAGTSVGRGSEKELGKWDLKQATHQPCEVLGSSWTDQGSLGGQTSKLILGKNSSRLSSPRKTPPYNQIFRDAGCL